MLDPTEMTDQPESPEPTSGPGAQPGAPAVADEARPPAAAPLGDTPPDPNAPAVYSRADLLAAASSFGAQPWDIAAALHTLGTDSATRDQVQAALAEAAVREV